MIPADTAIIEGRRPDRARVWTLSKAEVFNINPSVLKVYNNS